MHKVGSREFKNRMGRYLLAVRKGQSILITDRGRPVAKVIPPDPEDGLTDSVEKRLKELEAQGLIRLAKRPMRSFKAIPSRGKPASKMIIEDRR
ncbi:MAG TPA: type II toxin-antitoxin system prevent-host-death family antitoxin [Candidatus Sulfotelmatobacter sp.]|nr:type II toxin-antitoxin system prevent-host-death family antitoxin [Candidatus Sulfotelmatobacter sp.]